MRNFIKFLKSVWPRPIQLNSDGGSMFNSKTKYFYIVGTKNDLVKSGLTKAAGAEYDPIEKLISLGSIIMSGNEWFLHNSNTITEWYSKNKYNTDLKIVPISAESMTVLSPNLFKVTREVSDNIYDYTMECEYKALMKKVSKVR